MENLSLLIKKPDNALLFSTNTFIFFNVKRFYLKLSIFLKKKVLEDNIFKFEAEIKELRRKFDEQEYELERTCDKAFKLDRQLADTLIKLNNLQKLVPCDESLANSSCSGAGSSSTTLSSNHVDQNGKIMYHKIHYLNQNQNSRDSSGKSNFTDKQVS
jgi:hypothetical protein